MDVPSAHAHLHPPAPEGHPRHHWRHRLKRTFLTGLLILAPAALTVFVLVQLFQLMDGIFAPFLNRFIGLYVEDFDGIPGTGLALTLLVVLLLGWLSNRVGGRKLIEGVENVVSRIPIASSVYGATKGVLEALSHEKTEAFKRVVLIEYPKKDLFALAFVTNGARWGQIDERMGDLQLVFVPTTPNPTSGFLLLVPREETLELPMSIEEGFRMVVSGGILVPDLNRRQAGLAGLPVEPVGAAQEEPEPVVVP